MQNILLGVSGSIACYKAAELTRLLSKRGASVQVALTPAASLLVTATTFRALSGKPVLLDEWQAPQSEHGMDHIAAVRAADLLLVAPASADFIAKAAAGIADNLLLAAFLAADCPKYVAPAMNQQMWAAAATQRNIEQLKKDGVRVLGPDSGEQACGEHGDGRLLEVEAIADEITAAAAEGLPLAGKRVVVSAGATVEYLDAIRTISNRSSGKMGFCLAQAAADLGADVQIVAGQFSCPPPVGLAVRSAVSGEAMLKAVMEETADADYFFSVAAVADFGLAQPLKDKPTRESGEWTLTLSPTTDILAAVAAARPQLCCLAFAAQVGNEETMKAAAREKMVRKGVGLTAMNSVGDAGRDDCQLTLLHEAGEVSLPRLPKQVAARRLLQAVLDVSCETSA